jgi:hypothetical protein
MTSRQKAPLDRRQSPSGKLASSQIFDWSGNDSPLNIAFINTAVNLLGFIFLCMMYFNYLLLQPYLYIFLWSAVFSIPLHSLKSFLADVVLRDTSSDSGSSGFYFILWRLIRAFFSVL